MKQVKLQEIHRVAPHHYDQVDHITSTLVGRMNKLFCDLVPIARGDVRVISADNIDTDHKMKGSNDRWVRVRREIEVPDFVKVEEAPHGSVTE
jgi:hypothetical protein